jgi:radical SAM/Cys-rich protein
MKKSLKARNSEWADTFFQLEIIDSPKEHFTPFVEKMETVGLYPLRPTRVEILQINVGKMCNQTCQHCHVDAGPDRKEIMSRETMEQVLAALDNSPDIDTVDITGGAPEMNPHFRWFVEQVSARARRVMIRCNLTIILANKKYHDLPAFYRAHGCEVVSSLPFYQAGRTDRQRGDGVFEASVKALRMLNAEGYGVEGSGLILDLVYNPAGAFLPAPQEQLERDFKAALSRDFGISFNHLFAITNMPISRFLEYLHRSGNYQAYMDKLVNAFNPAAALGVMCRNTISISWDGFLYDCDFNQMLELRVNADVPQHISAFDQRAIEGREIVLRNHCYGCTAGAGSSCEGATA